MKENYQQQLDNLLIKLDHIPTLLLHSCCGPCSSYVITYLSDYFKITVLYYNPNIEPKEEYLKRKSEQIRLLHELSTKNPVDLLDVDYENDKYTHMIQGLEQEQEGGKRCMRCFALRLEKTAVLAKEHHYEYFTTTLTVSPHKNAFLINQIGKSLENEYQVLFLPSDFKKKEGYKKSIILSHQFHLYRQDYCGCKYSNRKTSA